MAIPDVLAWAHGPDCCKAHFQKLGHTFKTLYDADCYQERHCYCCEKHYMLSNIKYIVMAVIQLKYKNAIKHEVRIL